jgi:uncharacterized protein YecE (DUF72 family)
MKTRDGTIRVGIGGWTYEPWRKTFYPADIAQSRELDYASRQVTSIEINGTFYRLQKPAVFAKWHDATPDGFVFSVKAPRFIVQRNELASAGSAIERFLASGVTELKSKLGPILWQLADTKKFDAEDIDDFVSLLPPAAGELPLRHALEPRHESFLSKDFLEITRRHGVAVVYEDDAKHPGFADLTSTFVYARLRRSTASCATGYTDMGQGQGARGPAPRGVKAGSCGTAARCIHLFHQWRQGTGSRRRAEADFAALSDRLLQRQRIANRMSVRSIVKNAPHLIALSERLFQRRSKLIQASRAVVGVVDPG